MIAAVQEKLGLDAELSLSDLLDHPTLAEFAGHVAILAEGGEDSGTL
jgi:hypothetical protein